MPSQILAKSPINPHQSRKVYDYLKEEHKPIQKNSDRIQAPEQSPYSKEPTEYELIVEFELRRQKQKTLILEGRLRNKESFIKQMKQFQDELTVAFEKCQEELHFYKAQCQTYQNRSVSFPTFNDGILSNNPTPNISTVNNGPLIQPNQEQIIREYVEEIAELKHLVIRLEEQINYLEKKNKMSHNNKSMSYSQKYAVSNEKQRPSLKGKKPLELNNLSPINKKEQKNASNRRNKKQRSKTLANEFMEQKHCESLGIQKQISEFMNQQFRKVCSFISHFLTMSSFFDDQVQKQESIGQKLKKAWKWVKSTIVQWKYLKKQKVSSIKEYQIGVIVSNYLPVKNLQIDQIESLLQKRL